MSRWMSFDYGTKHTGIAVTDPLKLIASALDTVHTQDLFDFISKYLEQESVERFVVGEPLHPDGQPIQPIYGHVLGFKRKLAKLYPDIEVVFQDESHSSIEAREIIQMSGGKKKLKDKHYIDQVSAALILQQHMEKEGI